MSPVLTRTIERCMIGITRRISGWTRNQTRVCEWYPKGVKRPRKRPELRRGQEGRIGDNTKRLKAVFTEDFASCKTECKMPQKEVMVNCYDKSGTLLTSCSAISFDSGVVLMHGRPLAEILKTKLNKWFLTVLIGLRSEIVLNPAIDEKIEFIIHEEGNFLADGTCTPGRRMVSAGMWSCPLLKSTVKAENPKFDVKTNYLVRQLVSLFIFLETPREGSTSDGHHIQIFNIIDKLIKPSRGQNVIVQFTPFLDPILINSLSRGIVSRVFGQNDCMFLTDAVTTSQSCGAPIFLAHNESSETTEKGALMGITCRLFDVDRVTQGISLLPVLKRLLPPGRDAKKYPMVVPRLHVRALVDETIVFISCTNSRGTGIVIDAASGIILTCSHCVPQETSGIRVLHKGNTYPARLVYKTIVKSVLDLAVIQVSPGSFSEHMELADTPAQIGERVLAAGFPGFSLTEGFHVKPFISIGYIAKCDPSSFIMTTCFIFPGHSGGAIVRDGKLLGVITSTLGDSESSPKGKNDFRFGVVIPATVFAPCVKRFLDTKNVKFLKKLDSLAKKLPDYWPVPDAKM